MPITKDDFEELKHIYDYFRNKSLTLDDFCHQPICVKILQEMHRNAQLNQTLLYSTPLPEIHALIQSEMLASGIHAKTPSGWLFEHYFSPEFDRSETLRQFVFGFGTVEAIASGYPNAFAFTDKEIFPIVPALDDGMLQGIIKIWESLNHECEILESQLNHYKAQKENDITLWRRKCEEIRRTIEDLEKHLAPPANEESVSSFENDSSSKDEHDQNLSISVHIDPAIYDMPKKLDTCKNNASEYGKPKKSKNAKNPMAKISTLRKQLEEHEKHIDALLQEIDLYVSPREKTLKGLKKALASRESLIQYIAKEKSRIEIKRGEIRSRLYHQLTDSIEADSPVPIFLHKENHTTIEDKCIAFAKKHQAGMIPIDEQSDVYDLHCDILEYAEANQATNQYLSELEVFWAIHRNSKEWDDILQSISRSDRATYNRALLILFMNSEEKENRSTLIQMIKERYLSIKNPEEISEFISTLMNLDGNPDIKKAILHRLIQYNQDEQTKEQRLYIAKGAAQARERFFNQTYQAIRGLEEYAWNQEVHDKKLFETIAELRMRLKYIGIDTVVDPRLWIDQVLIPFRSDLHFIDGNMIPTHIKLRTMGFKFRKEDGKEEIERARGYIPQPNETKSISTEILQNGENL